MTRKQKFDTSHPDLFRVAEVCTFPLHRRAALVRGVAATMLKKGTQKQRLGYLNRELNFQCAVMLKAGLDFREACDETIRFRDTVVSEYHRLIYAPSPHSSEGDDAA